MSFCSTVYWLWLRKQCLFFSWREGCSCCGWSSCTCGCSLMFSTVAILLEALLKNVREVSHELMGGNQLVFFISTGLAWKVTSKVSLFITLLDLLELGLKYSNLNPNSPKCLVDNLPQFTSSPPCTRIWHIALYYIFKHTSFKTCVCVCVVKIQKTISCLSHLVNDREYYFWKR